ncbi:MAG TPA: DinB family protein [Terriglobales bacterium]|nr:DinB family protein [Terriglobales bacterium]
MTKDTFIRSAVVAALALLWASPGTAQTPGSSPAPGAGTAQPKFPATSFLAPTKATWESTRTLVLGIADSVPEDKYDFKPTPAVRTFREILIHLIGENYTFFSRVSGDNLGSNARFDTLKSRAEIMKALRESYDYGARVWEGLTEEKALEMVPGRGGQHVQRWAAILGVIQDNMNHYGNLVVYLRLNGIVPPRSASRN